MADVSFRDRPNSGPRLKNTHRSDFSAFFAIFLAALQTLISHSGGTIIPGSDSIAFSTKYLTTLRNPKNHIWRAPIHPPPPPPGLSHPDDNTGATTSVATAVVTGGLVHAKKMRGEQL